MEYMNENESSTKQPKQFCGGLRSKWAVATLRPMVVLVIFAWILLDYSATKKMKILLCSVGNLTAKMAAKNASFCENFILNSTSDFQNDVTHWVLVKNAIVFLPSVVIAPFIAFLLDRLPSKHKFYPYFLTPVGVILSGTVLSIGYDRFTDPEQILLSLIPVAATGGSVVLSLLAFAFVAYETVGKTSERVSGFVFLQVMRERERESVQIGIRYSPLRGIMC